MVANLSYQPKLPTKSKHLNLFYPIETLSLSMSLNGTVIFCALV
ncbi:Hypothetical protein MNA02_993 [Streptococcus thermophilus]|nr:hypothetical protein STND_0972 [Streptococcus thermophilus ND03]AKB97633.1 hypothetical protein SMQ301_1013 [Streptococcus thermophilus]AKH35247.1 Hypothetical protein MNA02_993 [Streptococcus thermophilus]AOZ59893.1 hypothetical protein BBD27_1809 [Streptococcus thermophilus]